MNNEKPTQVTNLRILVADALMTEMPMLVKQSMMRSWRLCATLSRYAWARWIV